MTGQYLMILIIVVILLGLIAIIKTLRLPKNYDDNQKTFKEVRKRLREIEREEKQQQEEE